jgi:SSS family solute:Na+ symporter
MQFLAFQLPFLVTIFLFVALSMRSAAEVKSGSDFAVAGRNLDGWGVAWAIIGTLVGGASTIGTVEMAYRWGFAGWYFTLGSGLACLILGLFFAPALRSAEVVTVAEYLGRTFGERFQAFCSSLTALGMFVHIIAQFLAAMAILMSVFGCSINSALGLTFVFLFLLVAAGGMKGAAWIGQAKFYFLCVIMGLTAMTAYFNIGGWSGFWGFCQTSPHPISLFSYGLKKGGLEILSVIIGVLSTQTYLQAVFSARDSREAAKGAIISAVLIPPIGILGILVGLAMKQAGTVVAGSTAQAFPLFIKTFFPAPVAAIFMGGLFFIVLGTGAGLALGVTTNLSVDFVEKVSFVQRIGNKLLRLRVMGGLVLAAAAFIVLFGLDTSILLWSYLSMGLRGSSILPGLLLIFLFPGRSWGTLTAVALGALPLIYIVVSLSLALTR